MDWWLSGKSSTKRGAPSNNTAVIPFLRGHWPPRRAAVANTILFLVQHSLACLPLSPSLHWPVIHSLLHSYIWIIFILHLSFRVLRGSLVDEIIVDLFVTSVSQHNFWNVVSVQEKQRKFLDGRGNCPLHLHGYITPWLKCYTNTWSPCCTRCPLGGIYMTEMLSERQIQYWTLWTFLFPFLFPIANEKTSLCGYFLYGATIKIK